MPIPPPSERPDLYDGYDYQSESFSADYLIAVTPDHIKQALEKKHGKPFAEIAQQMSDEMKGSE